MKNKISMLVLLSAFQIGVLFEILDALKNKK